MTPHATPIPVLRGAADAAAALPHLLGFRPAESLVLLWVREGRVCLTQRSDLPPGPLDPGLAARLVRTARGARAQALLLFVVCDDDALRPHAELVAAVTAEAEGAGVEVLDALHMRDDRTWSYDCADDCCPIEGRPIPDDARDRMAEAFGGEAPGDGRESIVAEIAGDGGDPRVVAAIEDAEAEFEEELQAVLERWRDLRIRELLAHLARVPGDAPPAPVDVAHLLTGLADVRVRDTVVWHLAREDEALSTARPHLAHAVRLAPPGYVAPVATVLALTCWQSGDGARAAVALDRALDDDADHTLAQLLARSVSAGLPPSAWREVVTAMPRTDCRAGLVDRPVERESAGSV